MPTNQCRLYPICYEFNGDCSFRETEEGTFSGIPLCKFKKSTGIYTICTNEKAIKDVIIRGQEKEKLDNAV